MSPLLPVISLVSRTILNSSIKQFRPTNHLRSLMNLTSLQRRHVSSETKDKLIDKIRLHEHVDYTEEYQSNEDNIYDREFVDMKVEDYESLYKADESGQMKATIETALKEYEFIKYNSNGRVPSIVDIVAMEKLLRESLTPTTRAKYFEYLFKKEMTKRAEAAKKIRLKEEREELQRIKTAELVRLHGTERRTGLLNEHNELIYGLWHNSLFCRIPETKLKHGNSTSKLIQAAQYNNKIVFDLDFDEYMTPWVCRNVVDQLQESVGLNRHQYQEPFDIWFCNFKENSESGQFALRKETKNLYENALVTFKKDCFTKYFDKSRLVYLSPNAKERLVSVGKNDDVYVIGVYNDKGHSLPLSYKKAKQLGIRTRCLPIDSYLAWHAGSKNLCINHVTGVLLEYLANGGDWREAFKKHIPTRKIKPTELVIEEEEQRLKNLRRKKLLRRFSIKEDLD